ncbi:sigma-54 interaction domain-containing protein [Wukongibacter sp. M2B1]|uniref:sigma-54 interaction domain-containing protein n=1 Tax=Wukongibacter sp. M2B1 TaxID=3088895 RepID=UPI003D79BAD9
MEHVAVIANNKAYSQYLADNLNIYFKNYAEFHYYNIQEIMQLSYVKEDYIVLSAFTIFQQVKPKIRTDAKLVISDLTLNSSKIDALYKLPKGTKALLVNIDYRSCMDVITMIYAAGFRDIELVPFYAGIDYDPTIRVAVTPDELQLVPKGINTIIDIGQRVVDSSSILQLADKLGVKDPFESEEAQEAKKNILTTNVGLEKALGENESLKERINVLLKLVKQGILVTDVLGRIYLANDAAKQMLKSRTDSISGFNIVEVLPELMSLYETKSEDSAGELIELNGKNLIASISRVISNDDVKGSIIMLENFLETENRQHKIRSKMIGKGHKATYTFCDILGSSPKLIETKKIAKRMAKSDSSVILYGESGVGKELFAQSIHNQSDRRGYHFVAVNCSALPETLLESELYGYEDGAFSGAKKGGKVGLFELAHNGTLFLDEIGELPIYLQAKLLRAIEERKILRIGGKDMIDINVRIITATNRNLYEMVDDKTFRSDLYYRLNVLPVHIPPLRERREDILMLFTYFCNDLGRKVNLSVSAKERMVNCQWRGNIRQLKNVAEYLVNLDKTIIEEQDLPFEESLKIQTPKEEKKHSTPEEIKSIRKFLMFEGRNWEMYQFILSELYDNHCNNRFIGRNKLVNRAKECGFAFTEQQIKGGLSKLNNYGFIVSGKGRKGSSILQSGIALKMDLDKMLE